MMEAAGCRWASTDYQAGDVLLFTSLTAHSALPNSSSEIRLSTDYRYCAASKPLVPTPGNQCVIGTDTLPLILGVSFVTSCIFDLMHL